jgi:hypothetical protein
MPFKNHQSKKQAGYLLVLVLVFGSIFLVMISSFTGFVISQNQVINFRHEQQRATEIAEAGLNYYRWYLAHFPNDLTTSTTSVYQDQEDGPIGEYTLDITRSSFCGNTSSIEVESTGFTYVDPSAVSTIRARYARPTVAEFSFITNGGVWYGSDRVITGPVHSNQGIRMDGSHNSFVGSGQTDWICDGTYGCSPSQTVDGVYTTSGNATPGLFTYPVSPIDFAGITLDLANMRTRAIADGIHFGPSGRRGYRVIFNGDDTVTVSQVRKTESYTAYSSSEGYHTEDNVIDQDRNPVTLNINPDCPILFFDDKVWLEGVVSGKVALAAADLSSSAQTNIVLNDNITYNDSDSGLLAIAEDDVDVGLVVPDNMTANGIYIAQNGRFGRNHYRTSDLSSSLGSYVFRNTLTRFGSVISNGRVGTQWINSSGVQISGFTNRVTSFDANQVDNPPPLTPEISDVFIFDSWKQDG